MKNFQFSIFNFQFLSLLFALSLLIFSFTRPVFAQDWYLLAEVSPECREKGDCSLNDILRIVVSVSKLILRLVGVLALIFFIVGGIIWITSAGNPEQVKKGKKILVGTLIGLLIVFFAWQVVNLIVCGLSRGAIAESCQIFGQKWYVFPGEKLKKEKECKKYGQNYACYPKDQCKENTIKFVCGKDTTEIERVCCEKK